MERKLFFAGLAGIALSGGVMVRSGCELASHSSEIRQLDSCGSFLSRVESEDMRDEDYALDFATTSGIYNEALRREGVFHSLELREDLENYFLLSGFGFVFSGLVTAMGYMVSDREKCLIHQQEILGFEADE